MWREESRAPCERCTLLVRGFADYFRCQFTEANLDFGPRVEGSTEGGKGQEGGVSRPYIRESTQEWAGQARPLQRQERRERGERKKPTPEDAGPSGSLRNKRGGPRNIREGEGEKGRHSC